MGAIRDAYGFDEALALALEAGVDLLLVANQLVYEPDVTAHVIDVIERLARSGRITEGMIDASIERVARLRPS
jgi:beta-N-acetylhexosaminidase